MRLGGKEASSDGLLSLLNAVEARLAVVGKLQYSSTFVSRDKALNRLQSLLS